MATSQSSPAVLVLDDGELDSVERTLKDLCADYVRLTGDQIAGELERPRDLLITSGKRTFVMPALQSAEGVEDPIWVAVHNQDFLPLRERMRGLGVSFLVHSSLDIESLRLFLLQMVHRGSERRASRRLPLGMDVTMLVERLEKTVRLLDVSVRGCRVLSPEPVSSNSTAVLLLPASISSGVRRELPGTVVRSSLGKARGGEIAYSVVLDFDDLEAEARAALEKLFRGEQIGAPVSPLADPASEAARDAVEQVEAEEQEQRGANRSVYERRVELLEPSDAAADTSGLGRDLSVDGVRVRGYADLEPGSTVTLALYGGRREEPVVVKSSVVRSYGSDEVAFRFEDLSAGQRKGLEKLAVGLGRLESLGSDGPIVVTKLLGDA